MDCKENLEKYKNFDACPIRNIISHFSGKWSMLILCILSENGSTRFSDLSRLLPDISPKVLTSTLKTLTNEGLVNRTFYQEIPPRVEYLLTEKGKSLMPIIFNLINWALENKEK